MSPLTQVDANSDEVKATLLFYLHDLMSQEMGSIEFFKNHLEVEIENFDYRRHYYFKPNFIHELARRVLMRAGLCHDVISLTQKKVASEILAVRRKIASATHLQSLQKGCRFVLRVDDFPSFFALSDRFITFHDITREHNIPYLLAITPYLHKNGLTASEIKILQKCRHEGMTPALHGFTHQRIRRGISSELLGMPKRELALAVESACRSMNSLSLGPHVFVAPFNSYDSETVSVLAEKFSILCGGPESVEGIGYRGPSFIEKSLYLPSYRAAYDLKSNLRWIEAMKATGDGLIIPITLHWHNEIKDNFSNFKKICRVIQSQILSWDELLSLRNRICEFVYD